MKRITKHNRKIFNWTKGPFGIPAVAGMTVVLIGLGFWLLHPKTASADWYDTNWDYRKAVTITVPSNGSDITSLETLITVDTSAISTKLQGSCQDLRFTSATGKLLPYYIDSGCTTSSTKIWVMVDLVPKSTTTYLMYMYYGNPSAVAGTDAVKFRLFNGLAAYWPLNESSWAGSAGEVKDVSVNGNNGTAANSASITGSGKYSNAGAFTRASNQYINIADNSALVPTNVTISVWAKAASALNPGSGQQYGFFDKEDTAGLHGYEFYMATGSNTTTLVYKVRASTVSVDNPIAGNVLNDGLYHHYLVTMSGTTVTFYFDGSQTGATQTVVSSIDNTNTPAAQIGAFNQNTNSKEWDGNIDDVRIYNRALSAAEIAQLYQNPGTIASNSSTTSNPSVSFGSETQAPGPTLYYKFDDGTGTSAKDSSSNANTGTLGGSTIPTWQTEDQSISGKSLFFDGASSKVTGSKIASAIKTVAFWVRPNTIATQGLMNLDGGTHIISTNGSGVISATGFTSPTYYINGVAQTSPTLVINQWNYVEITTGTSFDTTNSFTVGTDGSHFIKGFIDEVKFYNYARSAAQVQSDFNSRGSILGAANSLGSNSQNNINALNQGLIGYWKMDETSWSGSAGEVKDASGNGSNGAAKNGGTGFAVSSATANTLTGNYGALLTNILTGATITITSGTDNGDVRTVSSNTATQITVSSNWTVTPDVTTRFSITTSTVPTTVAGKFGNGGSFDGQAQYVDTGSFYNFNATDSFSLSSWVKTSTNNGAAAAQLMSILDKGYGFGHTYGLLYRTNTTSGAMAVFGLHDGTIAPTIVGATNIADGNWHLVTGVRNAQTKKLFIYVDGKLDGSANDTTTSDFINSTRTLSVGSRGAGTAGLSDFFQGKVDEARIYNRALSPEDVQNLYNFAPGPVGYYNFEEGSGSTVNDRSGNAFTGTWQGTLGAQWKPGKYGAGGNFNGTDNFVNGSTNTIFDANGKYITAEAWVNPSSQSVGGIISKGGSSGAGGGWTILNNGASGLTVVFKNAGSNVVTRSYNTALPLNAWTHIAVALEVDTATQGNNDIQIYINGVLNQSSLTSTSLPAVSVAKLKVGARGEDTTELSFFPGRIDEVKIYNYQLTQKQIVSDMNASHPNVGSPVGSPVGYWKFEEGQGTTATNSGSGGSTDNGILTNMATIPSTTSSGWTNSGKFGKALILDGANDYVQLGTNLSDLKPAGNFTISAWINTATAATNGYVFNSYSNNTFPAGIELFFVSGKLTILSGKNTGNTQGTDYRQLSQASATLTNGLWHHIVGTYDGINLYLYADGKLLTSTAWTNNPAYAATTYHVIGAVESTSTTPVAGSYFPGSIDEVKLYNYALTQDEINLDYNRGSSEVLGALSDNSSYQKQATNQQYCVPGDATSCVAPVGEWNFEEGSGSSVNDTSGNGHTGTWGGTLGSQWRPGPSNSTAGNFNGTDNYVDTGTELTTSSSISISTWVYVGTADFAGKLVAILDSATGNARTNSGMTFGLDDRAGANQATKGIYIHIKTASGSFQEVVNNAFTNTSRQWHHIVLTWDTTAIKSYVDGVSITPTATNFQEQGNYVKRSANLYIGAENNASTFFAGKIDQLRIYNYARTPAQVAWEFNHGGPVGWWKLDDCQGVSAIDSSGNARTGTISLTPSGTTTLGTCTTSSSFWGGSGGTGAGKVNYAPTFDGTDDIITTAAFSPLATVAQTTTKFSWGGWFFPTTSVASKTLIEKATEFQLTTNASSQPLCGVYYSSAFHNSSAPTTALTLSAWNHVECVYDGTNISTYLNGILIKQSSETNNVTAASSILYFAETSGGANFYKGQMDDIRVFNYALTTTQIQNIYNGGAVTFRPSTGAP